MRVAFDAEDMERRFRAVDGNGRVAAQLDVGARGGAHGEFLQGGHEAGDIHFDGIDASRHVSGLDDGGIDDLGKMAGLGGERRGGALEFAEERLRAKRRAKKLLAEVVVQLEAEAPLFALAGREKGLLEEFFFRLVEGDEHVAAAHPAVAGVGRAPEADLEGPVAGAHAEVRGTTLGFSENGLERFLRRPLEREFAQAAAADGLGGESEEALSLGIPNLDAMFAIERDDGGRRGVDERRERGVDVVELGGALGHATFELVRGAGDFLERLVPRLLGLLLRGDVAMRLDEAGDGAILAAVRRPRREGDDRAAVAAVVDDFALPAPGVARAGFHRLARLRELGAEEFGDAPTQSVPRRPAVKLFIGLAPEKNAIVRVANDHVRAPQGAFLQAQRFAKVSSNIGLPLHASTQM
jgi:hypothetical protein